MFTRLMHKLSVEDATLFGSSTGRLISVLFAERYPDRVRRLFLVAPAFVFGLPEAVTADILAAGAAPRTVSQMEAYLSRVYANPPTGAAVIEALLAAHKQVNSGGAVISLARSIKSGKATFSDDRIAALKAETLIVHGTQDGIVPIDASRNLASKLESTFLHEFNNAGHWPQIEGANTFNDLVADRLRSEKTKLCKMGSVPSCVIDGLLGPCRRSTFGLDADLRQMWPDRTLNVTFGPKLPFFQIAVFNARASTADIRSRLNPDLCPECFLLPSASIQILT